MLQSHTPVSVRGPPCEPRVTTDSSDLCEGRSSSSPKADPALQMTSEHQSTSLETSVLWLGGQHACRSSHKEAPGSRVTTLELPCVRAEDYQETKIRPSKSPTVTGPPQPGPLWLHQMALSPLVSGFPCDFVVVGHGERQCFTA